MNISTYTYPIVLFLIVLMFLGVVWSAPRLNTNAPSSPSSPTEEGTNTTSGNTLRLSNQNISQFPKYILTMTSLQELDLSYNKLEGSIPAEIRQLKNLKKLNLSHNLMTGLPAELGQLNNLEELDVSHNRLTGLPYELGNLSNLKRFVLTGNAFSEQDLAIIQKGLTKAQIIR